MPHISFSSLRVRLFLLVFLAIIPAMGLIIYTTAEQRQLATEEVQANVRWLTRLVAGDQERLIDETRLLLLTLTHLSEVRNSNLTSCSALFAELLDQYPQYTNLGVASTNGDVICSALPTLTRINLANRDYFNSALQKRGFAVGSFQEDPITGVPTVSFGYPVFDASGRLQSVVFASLNLNWLNQLVTQSQLPDKAALILIDRTGTVLVHYPDPEKWVGKNLTNSPLISAILSQGSGLESLPGLDGATRLYDFTPLSGTSNNDYYVGVGISEAVAFAQANQILIRHLVGSSIVFVLALIAAWFVGDLFILRRVRSLLAATERLAKGDLSARTGPPYGQGELSQLALAFDQMTDALEQRQSEHERFEEKILRQNRDLTALNTITATVSSSLDLPEVLESLKSLMVKQLNVPGGIIYIYDETDDTLFVEAAWGVPAAVLAQFKRFPANDLHYEGVVRRKEAVLREDVRRVMPFAGLGLSNARPNWLSYICVPLLAKGQVQGAVDLFSQAPTEFTQDHLALFTTLGQQVGVAIQNARLFEQIVAGRRRLQMLSQELLEIQEAERRHIARELHDEIGQALTALKVNLQAAQRLSDLPSMAPYIEESIGITERTLQQVRDLSLDLRPSLLDDLGVVAALRWYVDRQGRRAGFETRFVAEPPDLRLPSDLETTCFRVVQEALTNVVRHAKARRVEVELRQLKDQMELEICDDGIGFDVDAVLERASGDLSLGLLGMQERVQLSGGEFKIESDPTRGTEIRARFPLSRKPGFGEIPTQRRERP